MGIGECRRLHDVRARESDRPKSDQEIVVRREAIEI